MQVRAAWPGFAGCVLGSVFKLPFILMILMHVLFFLSHSGTRLELVPGRYRDKHRVDLGSISRRGSLQVFHSETLRSRNRDEVEALKRAAVQH